MQEEKGVVETNGPEVYGVGEVAIVSKPIFFL